MSVSKFIDNLPRQATPTDDGRVSRAPYNFVPLPERVVRAVDEADQLPGHDRFDPPGYPHSGYFEVRLTTETPLYIRAPLRAAQFAEPVTEGDYCGRTKNIPDFFHRGNSARPVIPGSSLRGMLRALIEILSYGKLTQVTDRAPVYRAVGDTTSLGAWYRQQTLGPNKKLAGTLLHFDYPSFNLKGGYLCKHDGDWAIRPARCDAATHHQTMVRVGFEHLGSELTIARRGEHRVHPIHVKPAPRLDSPRGNGGLVLNMAETRTTIRRRDPRDWTPQDDFLPAYLIESGVLSGKKSQYAIYEPDRQARPIPIPREMWEQYEDDRDLHRGDGRGSRRLGDDRTLLANGGDPLFYLVDTDGKLVFFGPTMMFRLPYEHSPLDLIPEPLRQALDIDFADALFGYVRRAEDFRMAGRERPVQGDPAWAYAGRVSVSDAVLAPGQDSAALFMEELTPRILSTPKPTTFQHYLVQGRDPKAPIRRPEDVGRLEQQGVEKIHLSHYDSPKPDMNEDVRGQRTVLRGTKLYWRQGRRRRDQLAEQNEVPPNSTQHTRMRPINAGKTFVFRIRFDNLSDAELGILCWALHPRGHRGDEYRHHLGMGKPFGMGVVKLEAKLIRLDRRRRYRSLFTRDGRDWESGQVETLDLADAAVRDRLVKPFEDYLLSELGMGPECDGPARLRRIGALLKLMEWPGPDPETVKAWEVKKEDKKSWDVWKDRRVLPPPSASIFGAFKSDQSVPKPPNSAEIFDWPPAESSESPETDATNEASGTPVDIRNYWATQQAAQQPAKQAALLSEIEEWDAAKLADELGTTEQAKQHLALFQGNEEVFFQAIAAKHQATLEAWSGYKGKKGRAFKLLDDWRREHGSL